MTTVKIEASAGKTPGAVLDKLLGQAATYPVRLAVTNLGKKPVVLIGASLRPIQPGATITALVRKREVAWVLVTDAAELAARGNGQVQLALVKDAAPAVAAPVAETATEKKKGA